MKVLMVVDKIEISGINTYIANMSEYLFQYGHEVVIFGSEGKSYTETKDYFQGVKVYTYRNLSGGSGWSQLEIIFHTWKRLSRIIEYEKPDLIQINGTLSGLGILLNFKRRKIPIVVQFFGAWDLEVASLMEYFYSPWANNGKKLTLGLVHKFKTKCRYLLQRWVIKQAEAQITLSNYAEELMKDHFKLTLDRPRLIISGSIDMKRLMPKNKRGLYKRELGIEEGQWLLVMISRLDPRKGIHLAIEAAKILIQKGLDFQLIIGLPDFNWSYYDHLLSQYEEIKNEMNFENMLKFSQSVNLVKTADLDSRQRLMRASDIFLMCSTDLETFGLTTIEAMASGAVVVGTPSGATPEILNQIKTQNLLTGDIIPEAIACKIVELTNLSSDSWEILRQECRNLIKKKYQAGVAYKDLVPFYQKLIR